MMRPAHTANLRELLDEALGRALAELTALPRAQVDAAVRPAGDPKFGDYQCNAALALAKSLGVKPRDLAERLRSAAADSLADVAEFEVAGPGFLNIRLRDEFIADRLAAIPPPGAAGEADRLGIVPAADAPRVVIDYSSPNIAKQMHVGHIRSTIIGDALARVLEFCGHEVIRQNHIGDWGTAIGMVVLGLWYIETRLKRGERPETVEQRIAALRSAHAEDTAALDALGAEICREWDEDLAKPESDRFAEAHVELEQLELGYRFVQALTSVAAGRGWKVRKPNEPQVDVTAVPRLVTRMLQEGGERNAPEREAWQRARKISLQYCQQLYARLGVLLRPEDVVGESFYKQGDRLAAVVEDMRARLATPAAGGGARAKLREDAGALCLFQYDERGEPLYRNADGNPLPMIIQKSDGAYLYATTDLAAMRYRIVELGGRRLLYVVGAPQKLHLEMLFSAARAIGWAGPDVSIEHVSFGQILGPDRKLLRTRLGGTVKLGDLLDEAERRAYALLQKRTDEEADRRGDETPRAADADAGGAALPPGEEKPLTETEMRTIAQRVGIAAVKYFDLNRDRNSDYVFDWDAMLSLKGNTAPYMMYAYARIRSIYRKAAERLGRTDPYDPDVALRLDHATERALALRLLRFPEALRSVQQELTPHVLCTYVYDLAGDFMRFYDACPVLQAPDDATRLSRLRLCDLAARTLRTALGLLGIEVIERM
jgi:arginyl-tRNA synthetase